MAKLRFMIILGFHGKRHLIAQQHILDILNQLD